MMSLDQPLDLYKFFRNWFSDQVSDEAVAWVADHSEVVTKKKGELIFAPGMDTPRFNVLLEGIMKTFIIGPDGEENTFAIYFQPGMSISMSKEMIEIPGMYMKALEPCKLIQMHTKDPFELAEIYPDLWRELTMAFQQFYFGMMDKLRAGYLLNAKERYLWFLNKYPTLAERIPQNEVALFLGIQPPSLSRIRTKLAKEQESGGKTLNREHPVDLYELYRNMLDESFDDEVVVALVKHSRIVTKDKGEIVFSPNAKSFSTYFILDGVMKTFVLSPDGTENTYGFFFQPGTGFVMNKETVDAAGIWCKTLTPCTLVELSPDIFTLADAFPPLWKNLVLGWRPFYFGMMDKLRAGYTLTAKERYLWFVDRFGPVVDKISLNEIALYLGIQPQSLSRIRNELAEGEAQS